MRGTALGLANLIGASSVESLSVPVADRRNVLVIVDGAPMLQRRARSPDGTAGSRSSSTSRSRTPKRLLQGSGAGQHRYQGLPE